MSGALEEAIWVENWPLSPAGHVGMDARAGGDLASHQVQPRSTGFTPAVAVSVMGGSFPSKPGPSGSPAVARPPLGEAPPSPRGTHSASRPPFCQTAFFLPGFVS